MNAEIKIYVIIDMRVKYDGLLDGAGTKHLCHNGHEI